MKIRSCFLLAAAVSSAASALAATWTGTAGSSWNTVGNWSDNALPNGIITYSGTVTNPTQTLDANWSVDGIDFSASTAVTLNKGTGTSLTLGASGVTLSSATANLSFAGATGPNLIIGANQTWTVNGGRTLTGIAGSTVATGSGTGNIAMVQSGTGVATIVFNNNGNGTGWGGYSGAITVNANVKVQSQGNNAAAFGTGAITLAGGTIAQNSGTWTWSNAIDATAASVIASDSSTSQTRSLKLTGNLTSSNGSGLTFQNNNGSSAKNDDSGFILAGLNASTYGATTIAANSRVRVGGNGTQTVTGNGLDAGNRGSLGTGDVTLAAATSELAFTRTDTHTVANKITGLGTLQIGGTSTAQAGTSTQVITLSGANDYTGATTVKNGTLKVGHLSALGAGATSVTGGTLDLGGFAVTNALTLGGGTLGNSGAAVTRAGAVALTTASSIGGTGDITLDGAITGAFGLTKVGGGTLTLNGATNAATGITVSAGTLAAGHATALGAGTVAVNGGALNLGGHAVTNVITVGASGKLIGASNQSLAAVTFADGASLTGSFGAFDAGTASAKTYNVTGGATFTSLSGQGTFTGGQVTTAGIVSAGGPGTRSFDSGLTLTGATTLAIGGNGVADLILTTGGGLGLTLGASSSLTLADFGANYADVFWDTNRTFTLINANSVSGNFATITNTLGGTGEGAWATAWNGANFEASWTAAAAIPEPSAYGLLGAAALTAVAVVRRRRRTAGHAA